MAAPSSTVWGSIVGNYAKLGIYTSVSSTATSSTVSIEVWFWTKYGCSDSNNTYYFNNNASSATTSKGAVTINHTVSSGEGWSTSNQTKIGSYSYSYTRGASDVKYNCAAKVTGFEADALNTSDVISVSTSYTIPVLSSYTVSFNANGGSGAPSSQTKTYGVTLTLSSTKPTRSNYTFLGWGKTSSDTSASYSAGSSYTSNADITLYAIWRAPVSLNYIANGGSGAPSNQNDYIYNATTSKSFTISSTTPTRSGYNFLGWSTSSTATSPDYSPNGSVLVSAGKSVTLYAVWSARPSQSVYIYNDGTVYARGYFTSTSTYIDNTGAFYAPKYTTGSSFYIGSTGIVAKAFKEGTP